MPHEADDELRKLGWCDVQLLGWQWSADGRDLSLRLRFPADGGRARELVCRWAAGLRSDLAFDERQGGPPLSWEGTLIKESGRWTLQFDFASAGTLRVSCESLELGPPG